jgi:hypothetical protein
MSEGCLFPVNWSMNALISNVRMNQIKLLSRLTMNGPALERFKCICIRPSFSAFIINRHLENCAAKAFRTSPPLTSGFQTPCLSSSFYNRIVLPSSFVG